MPHKHASLAPSERGQMVVNMLSMLSEDGESCVRITFPKDLSPSHGIQAGILLGCRLCSSVVCDDGFDEHRSHFDVDYEHVRSKCPGAINLWNTEALVWYPSDIVERQKFIRTTSIVFPIPSAELFGRLTDLLGGERDPASGDEFWHLEAFAQFKFDLNPRLGFLLGDELERLSEMTEDEASGVKERVILDISTAAVGGVGDNRASLSIILEATFRADAEVDGKPVTAQRVNEWLEELACFPLRQEPDGATTSLSSLLGAHEAGPDEIGAGFFYTEQTSEWVKDSEKSITSANLEKRIDILETAEFILSLEGDAFPPELVQSLIKLRLEVGMPAGAVRDAALKEAFFPLWRTAICRSERASRFLSRDRLQEMLLIAPANRGLSVFESKVHFPKDLSPQLSIQAGLMLAGTFWNCVRVGKGNDVDIWTEEPADIHLSLLDVYWEPVSKGSPKKRRAARRPRKSYKNNEPETFVRLPDTRLANTLPAYDKGQSVLYEGQAPFVYHASVFYGTPDEQEVREKLLTSDLLGVERYNDDLGWTLAAEKVMEQLRSVDSFYVEIDVACSSGRAPRGASKTRKGAPSFFMEIAVTFTCETGFDGKRHYRLGDMPPNSVVETLNEIMVNPATRELEGACARLAPDPTEGIVLQNGSWLIRPGLSRPHRESVEDLLDSIEVDLRTHGRSPSPNSTQELLSGLQALECAVARYFSLFPQRMRQRMISLRTEIRKLIPREERIRLTLAANRSE
jgi:hypothetical protein